MNAVENWYDSQYDEWTRLERHRIEFEITKRYFDQYIKGEKLRIFDIGGGPGRYSFYLAEKGHTVSLSDLSQHNIDVAKKKAEELGISLANYQKCDVLEVEKPSTLYDVVLLMGPLYHLTEEKDRKKAMENALGCLKKGGLFIASFISQFAPIQDSFTYLDFCGQTEQELLKYLKNGENNAEDGFTVAYFTSADEAKRLMAGFGLKQKVFAGVENILGCKEREILALDESEIQKWINLGYALSREESLLGTSQHFLYIGEK